MDYGSRRRRSKVARLLLLRLIVRLSPLTMLVGCGDDDDPFEPTGSCFYQIGGRCRITTEAECLAADGDYGGDGSLCSPGGPNTGGVLLVHYAAGVSSQDDQDCSSFALDSCDDVVVDSEVIPTQPVLAYVLAAFPESEVPNVHGVIFGIEYSGVAVINWGHCADFALPSVNWPASRQGIALMFHESISSTLFPLCWLTLNVQAGAQIEATTHPQQEAAFADDSVPAFIDPIHHFGELGFGVRGRRVCPGS